MTEIRIDEKGVYLTEISEGVKPVCPCGSLNVKKGLGD